MNKELKAMVDIIQRVAKDNDIHPQQVTKTMLINEGVTEWELRKLGSLKGILDSAFPQTDKDFRSIKDTRDTKSYIAKLEKQLGEKLNVEDEVKKIIGNLITPIKVKAPKFAKKVKLEREVVVMLNDTHYGLRVPENEVGGVNKYGWNEACRRTAYLAQQVIDYKVDSRHEVSTLHIVLNGDLVQGKIHDVTAETSDLITVQQNGAIHILANFIGVCAGAYKSVMVHGTHGNHDDQPMRREGGRVISHKHDSYLSPVYFALSLAFKANKNISFNFPEGMYADMELLGGKTFISHGDVMFSKQLGNNGSNLNTGGLGTAINKYNYGELNMNKKPYKLFLFGHTHVYSQFKTYDGVHVLIAPSLSGIDIFAKSLTININQVGQVIFESTKKHIIGDMRLINVAEADKDSSLDKIIPVYKGQTKWQK